jgi:hypothetical protein
MSDADFAADVREPDDVPWPVENDGNTDPASKDPDESRSEGA